MPAKRRQMPGLRPARQPELLLRQVPTVGRRVFKFASRTVAQSLKRTIGQAGLLVDDIDLFIPHQANAHIVEAGARLLRQSVDKFYMNIHKYGNTSTASVPLYTWLQGRGRKK